MQVRQLAADQRETERKEMKRSGYLQQRDARTQMLLDVMQRTMKQYMLDTLLITMHEDFGWGYDRLSRLAEKWGETYDVYFPAMQSTDESDVYQERLDRATLSYIGDNQFYSFTERYPEIKQLGYGPRRTK